MRKPLKFAVSSIIMMQGRHMIESRENIAAEIPSYTPASSGGVQFVQYADALAGIPGRPGEELFSRANAVIGRLNPSPEFLLFNGDHVSGYCSIGELRSQWDYFLETEFGAIKNSSFPVYHVPGNHDVVSLTEHKPNPYGRPFPNGEAEELFRRAFPEIPSNGPAGQEGLSWFIRGKNFLLIALHPIFSGRTATGFREFEWLDSVLAASEDKEVKIVASHFPVFPVNGYDRHAPYPHASWIIDPEDSPYLWSIFVRHRISAYLCGHVCAFDFQVHDNIPQLCSAGGGHPVLYPQSAEYHHAAQICIEKDRFRVQAVDLDGRIRERCEWPAGGLPGTGDSSWKRIDPDSVTAAFREIGETWDAAGGLRLKISGIVPATNGAEDQTLLCGWDNEIGPPLLWIGIPAGTAELAVRAVFFPQPPSAGEAVSFSGPLLEDHFTVELMIEKKMGPGGLLYRPGTGMAWNSMATSSPAGFEKWKYPPLWDLGTYQNRYPFRGEKLTIAWAGI